MSNIAVYIDGDNASSKYFDNEYNEIKKYGRIIIGRIYRDWTNMSLQKWKDNVINYSLETINCINLPKRFY